MEPFPGKLRRAPDGYHPYVLNEEQEAWLRATFPVYENRLVEKAMGITHPTMYRIAHQLGIAKSEEGLRAIKQRQAESHHQMVKQERIRLMSGYRSEKCTNIRAQPYTKLQAHCRYRAVNKYGYMVYNGYDLRDGDDERYKIYYNEETRRSAMFERTCRKYGLTIEEERDYEREQDTTT